MRLKIRHQTSYRFDASASAVIQTLRLTPRSFDGQHILRWRLDVDRNCRLRPVEDAFGNLTHVFAADGPIEELTVLVEGEVDTQDANGVIRGAVERFPPGLYLRETPLTAPDPDIGAYARAVSEESGGDVLNRLHGLMAALNEDMIFEEGATEVTATAAEAFRLKRGVCQDLTHVFLVAARHLGVPARYISGYFHRNDGVQKQRAGHAWAEAHVPGLGWVGFDPANCICPTDAHVRVAVGLDYLGAAPVRGSRYGGGGETLDVQVSVEAAADDVRAYRR
ncbi:MAG: transglutaminase family protein [Hansschlegelia sp.]